MFCTLAPHPSILLSSRVSDKPSCSYAPSDVLRHSLPLSCPSRRSLSLKRAFKKSSRLDRNLNRGEWRAMAEVIEQSPALDDDRKETFEAAAENVLRDDVSEKKRFDTGEENRAAMGTTTTTEREVDSPSAPTMPDDVEFAQRHPLDPHKPNFSKRLPEPLRPYPSFEGWFVRIWDPKENFSATVILATNFATDESQVTLLFAPGKNVDCDAGRDSIKFGYTYAVAVKTKDAKFMKKENSEKWGDDRGEKPEGFEWNANGIGRFVVTPHTMDLDFTVEGYNFKAHLTKEVLWDAHLSEKGPEGWARYLSIIPTHWYVFSLGSAVNFSFSNPEKNIHNEGTALGHVEKNWGQTFPGGHVWLQAFTSDNTSQLCFSGAYFNTPNEKFSTPYLFVLGYRSPALQLDFRSNDLGIVFKDEEFKPRDSSFSITAVGPSHTVVLTGFAPFDTFSEAVLAPVTKCVWEPACRHSYVATAEIKVYEHLAWGIPGTEKLVETQKYEFAALEFGEDLLSEAAESDENQSD